MTNDIELQKIKNTIVGKTFNSKEGFTKIKSVYYTEDKTKYTIVCENGCKMRLSIGTNK